MTIRAKAAISVISIVTVISLANFLSSFFLTQRSLMEMMDKELSLSLSIADDLVSTKIKLLVSDAQTVAERLLAVPASELEQVMRDQILLFNEFMAFTVFSGEGITAAYGYAPDPSVLLEDNWYLHSAFDGTGVISTTYYYEDSGELVMQVCVPMDRERVLAATIPGMLFSRIVGNYRLWETGNIFMLDKDGTMIANFRDFMVLGRYNFIDTGRKAIDKDTIGPFYERMISSDDGSGYYYYNGIERFCTYKRVSASLSGWVIGAAAPLPESPANSVRQSLLFSSLLFFTAGIIIAGIVSGYIAKPFHQIQKQRQRLEELNETVKAASEAKTAFLASMSHEMRTPLNAVIGLSDVSIELNRDSASRDDIDLNLKKIHNAGMTLLGTVNDILDISKIEAGKFELIPEEYSIPSLINDTVTQNIMRIGEKPIRFILNIDENLPSQLFGDELRIRQVINNLLSNAIKYTKEGTVELHVFCEKEVSDSPAGQVPAVPEDFSSCMPGESASVWMNARIKDSGIGIRKEDIDKLFSSYNQVDTRANRKIEGTGLGLAITKRLVEMMDGTINVESEYGKGSVFTIRIKQGFINDGSIGSAAAESLKNNRYTDQKQKENTEFSRISLPFARVLIVDDVAVNLDVARGILMPYGMQVDCVTSGYEAVKLIRDGVKYNAVFMDHMMPGMDGIEAARIIRKEINTDYAKTVPIIALTANALRGSEELFLGNGFQAFLSKPIDFKEMDNALRQWVCGKEPEKTADLPAASGKPDSPPQNMGTGTYDGFQIDGFNFKDALEHFGNEEILFNILRSCMDNIPPLIESMNNDLAGENLPSYAITAHGIKGSSRSIMAEKAGNLAEELEHASNAGDLALVKNKHEVFLETINQLLEGIGEAIKIHEAKQTKPEKDAPENDVLSELKQAALDYDIEGVDRAIAELNKYQYKKEQELITWLREQAGLLNFQEIARKL